MTNKGRKFTKQWKINLSKAHVGLVDKEILRQRGILGAQKRWANHVKQVNPIKHVRLIKVPKPKVIVNSKDHAEYMRLWRKANPQKNSASKKAYKARKKGALGSHSYQEWEDLKKFYGYICLCCKRQEPEIVLTEDHIIPLSKGGSDFIENIQPLCRSCNTKKLTRIINFMPVSNSNVAVT